jgi:hypothetical protein
MKIHLLPLPPPLPPAALQKTAPTAFEIEQMTEELIATARHWRTQRAKLNKVRKDRQRSDQGADSSKSTSRERPREDKVDVLA